MQKTVIHNHLSDRNLPETDSSEWHSSRQNDSSHHIRMTFITMLIKILTTMKVFQIKLIQMKFIQMSSE